MLARLRITLPDRPGSLGRVTTTLGTAGADIAQVDVLQSESGRALDDVFVAVRDAAHLAAITEAVNGLVGVSVLAVQRSVPPTTGHADLQLAAQALDRRESPEAVLRTLVEGAPAALGADWAALVSYDAADSPEVVLMSSRGPLPRDVVLTSPLRPRAVKVSNRRENRAYAGGALMPLEDSGDGRGLALLLVREEGPDYHRSELWRLAQLGRVLGLAVGVPV